MFLSRALTSITVVCLAFVAVAAAQRGERTSYLREDRSASPPLMPWQRNLDDALALSQATGKPLLICVNMDGELASEALAADRYRDPEFVALVDGFIPVLASPDRHDPLDYTSRGERVPDTKFGRVTNLEHIAIEPTLFERYFDGRRVAPRHVGIAPDGQVLFDLYLLNDLSKIDEALAEFGKFEDAAESSDVDAEDPPLDPEPASGDGVAPDRTPATPAAKSTESDSEAPTELDEAALLASPDAAHRERIEARFVAAQTEDRVRLAAEALSSSRATQHPELLNLALHDPDPSVRAAAIANLTGHPTSAPIRHFITAARLLGDQVSDERDALIAALVLRSDSTGTDGDLAALQLAKALREVGSGSSVIQVDAWELGASGRAALEPDPSTDWAERLGQIEQHLAADPANADWNVMYALNGREYAKSLIASGGDPGLLLQDVLQAAQRARATRPYGGPANALLGWSYYQTLDFQSALEATRLAVRPLEPWSSTPLAVETMDILADCSTRLLYDDIVQERVYADGLIADATAAHQVLRAHPLGTEAQAIRGLQLLESVDLLAAQQRAAREALERWPASSALHEWYRWILLRDVGPDGLLTAYDDMKLRGLSAQDRLSFAGLAKLRAAERRIDERQSRRAIEDYRLCIQDLETAIGASSSVRTFARWYQAQARAGRAGLYLAANRLDEALAEILLCFSFESEGHDQPGPKGVTPRQTLRTIRDTLSRNGRDADAQALDRFVDPPATSVSDEQE